LTILVFGIPLWLIHATSAPAGLVAVVVVVNTVMAVVLQVPFSRHATVAGGAVRVLRLAGVMLAGCSVALAGAAYGSMWLAAAAALERAAAVHNSKEEPCCALKA